MVRHLPSLRTSSHPTDHLNRAVSSTARSLPTTNSSKTNDNGLEVLHRARANIRNKALTTKALIQPIRIIPKARTTVQLTPTRPRTVSVA